MKSFSILVMSVMFFWSGVNKILNFDQKVKTLINKTGWPNLLCSVGMVCVILLETVGFFLLNEYYFGKKILTKMVESFIGQNQLIQLILLTLISFIIIVTLIYHPLDFNRPIPFLTNLTILGGFVYIYADIFN